jgi:hypothetical protein
MSCSRAACLIDPIRSTWAGPTVVAKSRRLHAHLLHDPIRRTLLKLVIEHRGSTSRFPRLLHQGLATRRMLLNRSSVGGLTELSGTPGSRHRRVRGAAARLMGVMSRVSDRNFIAHDMAVYSVALAIIYIGNGQRTSSYKLARGKPSGHPRTASTSISSYSG